MIGILSLMHLMLVIIALFSMVAIAIVDFRTHSIPDFLTIILLICGIGLRIEDHVFPLAAALIGGGFFAAQWIVSRGRWMGVGDVFLGCAMGVFLGTWPLTILMILCAYILGAIVALTLLLSHRTYRHQEIPFAPLLISGAVIALFFGEAISGYFL